MSGQTNQLLQDKGQLGIDASHMTQIEDEPEYDLNETFVRRTKKQSSFNTIFNISNTMMGSALLVMPINFYVSGMLSGLIAAIIMAVISYFTCNLIIIHSRVDEIDYPEAIERILGKPWRYVFNIMSMILLFLVGLIHFVLISETLYSLLKNVFSNSDSWANSDDISFSTFSMQYVGLIVFVLCALLFSIKNLKNILVINDKGVYLILIFSLFIIYLAIDTLYRDNLSLTFSLTGIPGKSRQGQELILFTGDIGTLIGIFALAYMIHNSITGIIKSNKSQDKNSRDLKISYLFVFILYSILGIAGMIAVAGLFNAVYSHYDSGKFPRTMMELLTRSNPFLTNFQFIFGSISLSLIFVQLTTVIPIICFFTRRQFFDLFYGHKHQIPELQFHIFNIIFNISCLIVEIFVLNINQIVGFTGAVGGFLLIYIIPIYLHMKCVYYNKTEGLISEVACNDHSDTYIKDIKLAYIIYSLLTLFGFGIMVALIYGLF
jgi:sodium-coupled neutral amino acid transporter 9